MKYLYPGSFDPITNGHLDIIERAAKLCDTLYVVIGTNDAKQPYFTIAERIQMIKHSTKHIKNVIVDSTPSLMVDYALANNIGAIIRGFRNTSDFEVEQELFFFNNKLAPQIETIILYSKLANTHISSSNIKELYKYNREIKDFVPKIVLKYFENKNN